VGGEATLVIDGASGEKKAHLVQVLTEGRTAGAHDQVGFFRQ
jgi:hypothetical protein